MGALLQKENSGGGADFIWGEKELVGWHLRYTLGFNHADYLGGCL